MGEEEERREMERPQGEEMVARVEGMARSTSTSILSYVGAASEDGTYGLVTPPATYTAPVPRADEAKGSHLGQ